MRWIILLLLLKSLNAAETVNIEITAPVAAKTTKKK